MKDGEEVEKLRKDWEKKIHGAKTKYEEALKRTGMLGPPLTTTETEEPPTAHETINDDLGPTRHDSLPLRLTARVLHLYLLHPTS